MAGFESSLGQQSVEITDGSTTTSISLYIAEKIKSRRTFSQFSICRVPQHIRRGDPGAYEPQVVSIGPYHHGAPRLKAMEDCKWRILAGILEWSEKMGHPQLLGECLRMMKENETVTRECYADDLTLKIDGEDMITAETFVEGIHTAKNMEKGEMSVKTKTGGFEQSFDGGELLMKTNKFAEMLLLDGCFLLCLLLQKRLPWHPLNDDPVFNTFCVRPRVALDLLLLENQLPFFILQILHSIFVAFGALGEENSDDLREASRAFFLDNVVNPTVLSHHDMITGANGGTEIQHLLHFIHMLLPLQNGHPHDTEAAYSSPDNRSAREHFLSLPTVTKLSVAGVKFQKPSVPGSFLHVAFVGGKMELGELWVDDFTNVIFRNFIALEQCFNNHSACVTNYCYFMDMLVNTDRDVEVLHESGIVKNLLGSDEVVAALFNKLMDGVSYDPMDTPYLLTASTGAWNYSKKRRHKWRAKFVGDYFSNPWATISLIAGIVIFIVGIGQLVYSMLSFYKGSNA